MVGWKPGRRSPIPSQVPVYGCKCEKLHTDGQKFQSKTYQLCDMGENDSVEHVFLECEGYVGERWEMIQTTLRELLGCEENERIEKTGKEWMMVLVGLSEESTEGIIKAVKEFLERAWSTRQKT